MAVAERTTETTPLSLAERINQWVEAIDKHLESGKGQRSFEEAGWPEWKETDELLAQGYRFFFEILEPLKEEGWIRAEQPDIHQHIFVETLDKRIRGFDPELFAGLGVRYMDKWEINIYEYRKMQYSKYEKVKLELGNAGLGDRGEKVIRIEYNPSHVSFSPGGVTIIEDRTFSYIRGGKNAQVETVQGEKKLHDYPGLTICKLAVSLVQIFVEEHAKKQQAQAVQPA